MKVGYFGDGIWAHESLKRLIKDKDIEICFVTPRFDYRDQELVKIAQDNGIPVEFMENVNSTGSLDLIKKYEVDLLISMSFNQIIKKELLELPNKGFINCHAGALPRYRGRNIVNWALINDEKEFGITVHYIDEGIDTGDIIHQQMFPITDDDDYKSIVEIAYDKCPEVLLEGVNQIKNGTVKARVQRDDPTGFYCSMRKPGDEIIDWNQTSRDVFNFIRAITYPAYGARTQYKGKEVTIIKSKYNPDAPVYKGVPGSIVGRDKEGVFVKTLDSTIKITEVSVDDQVKVPRFMVGNRFN